MRFKTKFPSHIQLTSKRSTSIRDESDDIPSQEDEPKSEVVRDRTSICSCRQYSSDRSLNLRSYCHENQHKLKDKNEYLDSRHSSSS